METKNPKEHQISHGQIESETEALNTQSNFEDTNSVQESIEPDPRLVGLTTKRIPKVAPTIIH
jgi:hypothetical protein